MKPLFRIAKCGYTNFLFRGILQSSVKSVDTSPILRATARCNGERFTTFDTSGCVCYFSTLTTPVIRSPLCTLSPKRKCDMASGVQWTFASDGLLVNDNWHCSQNALFSTHNNKDIENRHSNNTPATTKKVGILQRFKNAYKQYGKVLIGVHCATSVVWLGSFYYAAQSGVDVVPLLEKIGTSEKIIQQFQSSGLGNIAVAYLLYKLATPARYTVTIGGTQGMVRILQRFGYMKPVPEGDSLRALMKEGREQVKDKISDRKEEWKDKADDIKDKFKDKREDMKDKVKKHRKKVK